MIQKHFCDRRLIVHVSIKFHIIFLWDHKSVSGLYAILFLTKGHETIIKLYEFIQSENTDAKL